MTGARFHPLAARRHLRRSCGARVGFTVIEVLLTVIILAMLAAILVPNFTGMQRRQLLASVDRLEDLMSAYAYRDALGGQPVAIWHDPETNAITLLVLHRDPDDPEAETEWLVDRFTRPVVLPEEIEIVEVLIDRRRESLRDWLVTRVPGQPRPWIEIDLAGPDIEVTLVVSPTSLSAARIEAGRAPRAMRMPVDLDARGADRERW